MRNRFEPQIEHALRAAGWHPHRKIAEEELTQLNSMRPLFPAARLALQEFDNLYFNEEIATPTFCIDAKESWNMFDSNEDLDEYKEYFGCAIYPIGIQGYQFMPLTPFGGKPYVTGADNLLIDERGRVFLVRYVYTLVGETVDQALQTLITGKGFREWDTDKHVPITR